MREAVMAAKTAETMVVTMVVEMAPTKAALSVAKTVVTKVA